MAATASMGRFISSSRSFRTGLILVAIMIILNGVYWVTLGSGGVPFKSEGTLAGAKLLKGGDWGSDQIALTTVDNKLLVLDHGKTAHEKQFDSSIGDFTISADKQKLYVGTNNRDVFILDKTLQELGHFQVNGKVTGITDDGAGNLIVSYGIGQYSEKFWIGKFKTDGTQLFKEQIGFDVSAVGTDGKGIYFGTLDAKVGLLGPDGKEKWRNTVKYLVTRMSVAGEKGALIGDERGNVLLISNSGAVVWSNKISPYKITMLAPLVKSGDFVAGDENGNLALINPSGQVVYNQKIATSSIIGTVGITEQGFTALSYNGDAYSINLKALNGAKVHQAATIILAIFDAVSIAGAALLTVLSVASWRTKLFRFLKQLQRSRAGYALVFPSFILILVFSLVPTVMAIYYSFTNFNLSEPIKFIGLQNFAAILHDDYFWTGMHNMILILVTSIVKHLTMPLIVAELIFWLRNTRLKYMFRTAFVLPSIVPGIVGILLWKMMYEPETGFINQFLRLIGLSQWTHPWLAQEGLAIWSIIFAGFPFIDIFAFLVYFGGLIGISREIYDSASIDGVGAWKRFLKIDVPMILPQIRLVLFFTFIGSIQGFANIWIFTRGGPGKDTYVPGLQMYFQVAQSAHFGYASALGVVLSIFVLIGVYINSKVTRKVENLG